MMILTLSQVFIAGSGPIGALFARQLVDQGHNVSDSIWYARRCFLMYLQVVMVEMGDQ